MATADFEELAETRPRIRRDVLYTETTGGVLFHNADGGFRLAGRTAYRFASLIVPHLTGEHRLTDLCEGLGATQRDMVVELVSQLLSRDFARDHRPGPGPAAGAGGGAAETEGRGTAPLDQTVADRFAAQIAYVDHYVEGAPRRFARFRGTRVAVLGTGEVARWAVLGLLRNGCADVAVEGGPDESAQREAAELADGGCDTRLTALAGPPDSPTVWDDHDVLLVTGPDAGARTHRLLAAGIPSGRTLIPVWTFGEHVVIGPRSTGPGADGPAGPDAAAPAGCWSCALLRLGTTVDAATAAELWRSVADAAAFRGPRAAEDSRWDARWTVEPHGPLAAMVGNLLGYEVFRDTTGALPPETAGRVLLQDLSSLDVLAEPLHQHPRCVVCRAPEPPRREPRVPEQLDVAAVPTVETARDAEELVAALNQVTGALVQPHTGVFSRFDDEELVQTPLKLTRLELPLGPHGTRRIAAFDVHHLAGARQRALRTAATLYVDYTVPADVATDSPHRPADVPRLAPDSLVGGAGTGLPAAEVPAWAEAVSLISHAPALVPLSTVRPFGPANQARTHLPSSAGSGAGAHPGEAAAHGLLSALALDALVRAVRGQTPVTPCPDHDDPELVFLRASVTTLDGAVEVLDLGEAERSGAHVVLAREEHTTSRPRWAVGAGLTQAAAAAAALRDLLGQLQLADAGSEPADTGDPLLADLDPRSLPVTSDSAVSAPGTSVAGILRRLRASGRDALLVPTTPADLAAGGLATARVLLTRGDTDEHR